VKSDSVVIRLTEWARQRQGKPFVWGQTDCAILCFEAADIVNGTRLADRHRDRYHSAKRAWRYMRRNDVSLSKELARAGLGQPGGNVLVPGDILIHPRPDHFEGGYVVFGKLCLSSEPGLGVIAVNTGFVLQQRACKAWRKK